MTPHVYLIECMPSIGAPISIVLIPVFEAKIGPKLINNYQ
jgi:hypothetical protein